jgi:hypothetical protein
MRQVPRRSKAGYRRLGGTRRLSTVDACGEGSGCAGGQSPEWLSVMCGETMLMGFL